MKLFFGLDVEVEHADGKMLGKCGSAVGKGFFEA